MDPVDISTPPSRAINTTSPLTGGGDLSADRTVSIADGSSYQVVGASNLGVAGWRHLTTLLDGAFGSGVGTTLRRGGTQWEALSGGASNTLLTISSNEPTWRTLSALFDAVLGSTRGMVIRRGSSAWEALSKGSANTILSADANDTAFQTLSALIDGAIGSTRGAILYRGASGWAKLDPDTAGHVLTDGGSGADPSWAAPASGGVPTAGDWGADLAIDADKTLVSADDVVQVFKPTANRTCTLAAAAAGAQWKIIEHAGLDDAYTVSILDPVTGTVLATLQRGQEAWCVCDGERWFVRVHDVTTSSLTSGYDVLLYAGNTSVADARLLVAAQTTNAASSAVDGVTTVHRAASAGKIDKVTFIKSNNTAGSWDLRVNGTVQASGLSPSLSAHGALYKGTVDVDVTVAAGDEISVSQSDGNTVDTGNVKIGVWLRTTTTGFGYSLQWGGDSTAVGRWLRAYETPGTAINLAAQTQETDNVVTEACVDSVLVVQSTAADNTTDLKLWVNGIVTETIPLSGAEEVYTLSGDSYAVGDTVALEFDAGTDPGVAHYRLVMATPGAVHLQWGGDGNIGTYLPSGRPTGAASNTTLAADHGYLVPYRMELRHWALRNAANTNLETDLYINGLVDQTWTPDATTDYGDLTPTEVSAGDVVEIQTNANPNAGSWHLLGRIIGE